MENPHDGTLPPSPAMERCIPRLFIEPVEAFDFPTGCASLRICRRSWSLYNFPGVCTFVAAPVYTLTFDKMIEALKRLPAGRRACGS